MYAQIQNDATDIIQLHNHLGVKHAGVVLVNI